MRRGADDIALSGAPMATTASSSAAMVHPAYRPDIDGLRAVAILPVVVFHAFPGGLPGGFVGVDIFFVISGYLISGIILASMSRGTFSLAEFYARRVRRIFPALGVVLATAYAAGWLLLYPDEFKQLCKHIAAGAGFVANIALGREGGYFDTAAEAKPMLHLWSLGVEEQFYIAWPLLLWLGWRLRLNAWLLIGGVAAASLAWNFARVGPETPGAFFSPLVRFWELAVGALLAQATATGVAADGADRPVRPVLRDALSVAGALLIGVALAGLDRDMPFPGWRALLPVGGAALLIAAGPGALVNRRLLARPGMVWVGLISYPLYLWHWPILSFVTLTMLPGSEVLLRVAGVLLSVLLAWATWRFVEVPVRFGPWRGHAVPVLVGGLAAVGSIAFATNQADGLPGRMPAATGGLAAYRYDWAPAYRSGTCFIESLVTRSFGDCVDQPVADPSAGPPAASPSLVLLWGDSHAAHLAAGLRQAGARLAQYTAAGCPPILGLDISNRPNCRPINDAVMVRIAALAPATVVLAANWKNHDWRRIAATVAALRTAGVGRVVVVGPVPQWRLTLPKVLLRHAARGGGHIPERTSYGLETGMERLDRAMQPEIERAGAVYASPYRVLCDAAGCLTHTGALPETLVAFDNAHLTAFGAALVVRALGLP